MEGELQTQATSEIIRPGRAERIDGHLAQPEETVCLSNGYYYLLLKKRVRESCLAFIYIGFVMCRCVHVCLKSTNCNQS